ncbi:MAG: respiratory nitrate reductase subunit gamma [Chloroflexi bacterium]|nr:respiratory nitrate reductase subunit gamma [Chloroflexota bacterium]
MIDTLAFVVFPYVAVALVLIVTPYRYFSDRFSYSSFSSELLQRKGLFWGSVAWHYGVILILLAHLAALLAPGAWAALISEPTRLYVLEVTGLALALATVAGMVVLIGRRLFLPRVASVTTRWDWVVLFVLLAQVALGFWVALFYRWGSDWYLHTAVPWIVSLATLNPQTQFVASLPILVQIHMLGGFVLLALFPFTRLVHMITFPVTYLWRPYQVVIWNRRRRVVP